MQQMKVFLIALLTIFVGSATAQTTSVSTIIVNDTTIADATSLADAIQKAGITDSTKVTSIHYTKGVLVGSYDKTDSTKFTGDGDWATIRTLDNLETFITDSDVVVTDMPIYEFYDMAAHHLATKTYVKCPKIKTISLATIKSIGNGAFAFDSYSDNENVRSSLQTINLPEATDIGRLSFAKLNSLKTLSLPKAVKIGYLAFANCDSLTSISLPEATTIAESAFEFCEAIKNINLPKVETIGNDAFQAFFGNTSLETISLPKAVSIGAEAFKNCKAVKNLSLPNVECLGDSCFLNNAIGSLTTEMIPKIRKIGYATFASCRMLESVDLPLVDSLDGAFINCDALAKVNLPKVKVLKETFTNCYSLTNAKFPELTEIGDGAFASCEQLSDLSCPKATVIGFAAFAGCGDLSSLSLPNVIKIGPLAFSGSKIKSISLPEATEVDYEAFMSCNNLATVSLPKAKVIRWGAFSAIWGALTSITLPAADTIEFDAFKNSGIKHVELPAVKYIGSYAFQYSYDLSSVSLPTVPPLCEYNYFNDAQATLLIVDANDSLLKGDAFTSALEVYKKDRGYSATTGKWNGLKLTSDNVPTAIESVNAGLAKIWSEGGSIYVSTPAATNLTVVSAIGRMIRMSAVPAGTTTIGNLSSGIYFVRLGNETRKIAVK